MKTRAFLSGAILAAVSAGTGQSQTRIDLRTQTKSVDFSSANATSPSAAGSALPATCKIGQTFILTSSLSGQSWYICSATNQWTVQGIELPSLTGNSGALLSTNGSGTFWKTFGGDVSGTVDALSVTALRGRSVSTAAPSSGQILAWNGSQWAPQTINAGVASAFGRTGTITAQTGDYSFAQIGGTLSASQVPATGGDLTGLINSATVTKLQGWPVVSTTPTSGQVLTWNGSQWAPQTFNPGVPTVFGRSGAVTAQSGDYSFAQISGTLGAGQLPAAGGDLSGTLASATVGRLQGRAVSSTAPSTGQVLMWNGSQWLPQTPASGGGGSGSVASVFGRTGSITSAAGDYTFAQINGTIASGQLPAAGGDIAGSLTSATVAGLQGAPVAVTAPASGQVLTWSGTQWTPQAAPVASIFGRTGAVIPQTGDYSFSQIGGAAAGSQLPALGGDLLGAVTSASVTALQGRPVTTTPPSTGQVLAWTGTQWTPQTVNAKTGAYTATLSSQTSLTVTGAAHQLGTSSIVVECYDNSTPANAVEPSLVTVNPNSYDVTVSFATAQSGKCVLNSGGGGGNGGAGGATLASQLGDFTVTRANATTLTIGAGCAPSTPCNARIGSQIYSFTASASATLTAGSGMAFIYVDANGVLTVGHSMSVTCSAACAAVSGITGFPTNAIPLFTWTATSGFWDASGGNDRRGWIGETNFASGPGIVTVQTAGLTTVSVDSSVVPTYLSGSATLAFTSIAAGTCSAELTIPVSGANAGDAVIPGWPANLAAGLTGLMHVTSSGVVSVRLCASSAAAVTPASATFQAVIVRSF